LSKHKKSTQRKLDISNEVDALQNIQDEIRIHGQPLNEKSNDELFKIDNEPMSKDEMVKTLKTNRKQQARDKLSMVDKILAPNKNIKPLSQLRSKSNLAEFYQNKDLCKQMNGKKPVPALKAKKSGMYDLWNKAERSETMQVNLPKRVDGKGIGHGTNKYTNNNVKFTSKNYGTDLDQKRLILDKLTKLADATDATKFDNSGLLEKVLKEKLQTKPNLKIDLPDPGQSYKPDPVYHQNLLKNEHEKLLNIKMKNDKIEKLAAWDEANRATAESDFKERAEGLFGEEDDWEDENEAGADTDAVTEKIDFNFDDGLPKSDRARKRLKAHNKKVDAIRKEKALKAEMSKVYEVKRILRDHLEDCKKKRLLRLKKNVKSLSKMPRLSSTKFSNFEKELKLTNEIEPSLRRLTPEGSILSDRYKSLVAKSIIEPHTVHRRKYLRKYKAKYKVRRSVKNILGSDAIL